MFKCLSRFWIVGRTSNFNSQLREYQLISPERLNTRLWNHIEFNVLLKEIGYHVSAALSVDRNVGALFIFEERWVNNAAAPKITLNSHTLRVHWLLYDYACVFRAPNMAVLLVNVVAEMKIRKDDFLNKIAVIPQLLNTKKRYQR